MAEEISDAPVAQLAAETKTDAPQDATKFDFGEKRKKGKKSKAEKPSAAPVGSSNEGFERGPVYEYDKLLERVQEMITIHNPKLQGSKKYLLKPPQVVRYGAKKSVWVNFEELCRLLHRDTDHVCQFVLAELAIDGSIAGDGQLVLKGRFTQKDMEKLLRKYIREYVACRMCKAATTKLERDSRTRLYTIICSSCGANRSVATIKSGFHAVSRYDRRTQRSKE